MTKTSRLSPCPDTPNCVCSDDKGLDSFIEPIKTGKNPEQVFDALHRLLQGDPKMKVTELSNTRITATVTSSVMRFVDDLEFELRPDQSLIAVRSASRVGYWDLGANRARIEKIRKALTQSP